LTTKVLNTYSVVLRNPIVPKSYRFPTRLPPLWICRPSDSVDPWRCGATGRGGVEELRHGPAGVSRGQLLRHPPSWVTLVSVWPVVSEHALQRAAAGAGVPAAAARRASTPGRAGLRALRPLHLHGVVLHRPVHEPVRREPSVRYCNGLCNRGSGSAPQMQITCFVLVGICCSGVWILDLFVARISEDVVRQCTFVEGSFQWG